MIKKIIGRYNLSMVWVPPALLAVLTSALLCATA